MQNTSIHLRLFQFEINHMNLSFKRHSSYINLFWLNLHLHRKIIVMFWHAIFVSIRIIDLETIANNISLDFDYISLSKNASICSRLLRLTISNQKFKTTWIVVLKLIDVKQIVYKQRIRSAMFLWAVINSSNKIDDILYNLQNVWRAR